NALITAVEAFADADKQGQNIGARRIVLISDLQEGSRLDGLQGYDWPRGIEVDLEPVTAARPTNVGLQWVVDADDSANTSADAGPRVRVVNASNSKREQFQIRWDGVTGATPLDVYVPPGQSRIVPAPPLATNTTAERLMITGNDDDFDNTIYLVQPKPEQVKVLFLGNESERDPAGLLYYLKRAFQQTRRQIVQVNGRPPDAALAVSDLAGARLLIIAGVSSDNQFPGARKFLSDGGTILVVLTNAGAALFAGRLAGADNLSASEAAVGGYAMFGRIDFEHPLFAPFADPRY